LASLIDSTMDSAASLLNWPWHNLK
jgi:hypothetical protein